jgi:SAM-dependent methyltransferase/uncharacterized protein YbaR (Trm112 family)
VDTATPGARLRRNDLGYYVCPQCRASAFRLRDEEGDAIVENRLYCRNCGASFPVIQGIPRFVTGGNYAENFGLQWKNHSRTQLDSYTGLPISRNRLFDVTTWPTHLDGQTILEAGSGAGRFTEILLQTGATVFSFDYSAAVEANAVNNGHSPNLILFQGDIYNIPLRKHAFDKVICLGVLQHTPDPEKAFQALCPFVRKGGEIIVDIYSKRISSLLQWKYVLRPLTKRTGRQRLYRIIASFVPVLLPFSAFARRHGGRLGARLMPVADYSHLPLPYGLNKEWSILDTFDMYAPAHDHPQTLKTVQRWFKEAGLNDIHVGYGPNGIVGRGKYG